MGFSLTPAQVQSFASQGFIKKALKNPFQTTSVLSFFFNVDYQDPSQMPLLHSGDKMQEMSKFWYGSSKEYDELCENFRDVIRKVGKAGPLDDEWSKTVDGKMAQIILFDQLARNAFRSQNEAYAYDGIALNIARNMSKELLRSNSNEDDKSGPITIPGLSGEVYISYLQFIGSPMIHSEELEDHELCVDFYDYTIAAVPEDTKGFFKMGKQHEIEHKEVIEKFGRYPHRNKQNGRENTKEELEWLSNVDELPGWARSQGS